MDLPDHPIGLRLYGVSPLDEHATLQADITQISYTMAFVDGTRKTFNNGGYLTAITDRNGNKTAVNYDTDNRITNVTDAAGRVLTFNYGPALRCPDLLETLIVRNIGWSCWSRRPRLEGRCTIQLLCYERAEKAAS